MREEEKRIVFEFADDAAQSAGGSCVLCPGPLEALIRVASSSPKHISRRPLCEWQSLQTSLWQNRVGAITRFPRPPVIPILSMVSERVAGLAVARPRGHQRTALFERVAASVGPLCRVADNVRECRFRDFARKMRLIARPIAEG